MTATVLPLLAGALVGFGLGFVAGAAFVDRTWARRIARATAARERSRREARADAYCCRKRERED